MGWRRPRRPSRWVFAPAGADRSAGADEAERKSDRVASRKPRGAIASGADFDHGAAAGRRSF